MRQKVDRPTATVAADAAAPSQTPTCCWSCVELLLHCKTIDTTSQQLLAKVMPTVRCCGGQHQQQQQPTFVGTTHLVRRHHVWSNNLNTQGKRKAVFACIRQPRMETVSRWLVAAAGKTPEAKCTNYLAYLEQFKGQHS
jgi:hypothetical protein